MVDLSVMKPDWKSIGRWFMFHGRPEFNSFVTSVNSPLSHGGHIVPGDQKGFVSPRIASQSKPWEQSFFGLPGQYGRRVTKANSQLAFVSFNFVVLNLNYLFLKFS